IVRDTQRITRIGCVGPKNVCTLFSARSSNAAPRRYPSQNALLPALHVSFAVTRGAPAGGADDGAGDAAGDRGAARPPVAAASAGDGPPRDAMNTNVSTAAAIVATAINSASRRRDAGRLATSGAFRTGCSPDCGSEGASDAPHAHVAASSGTWL